MFLPPRKATPAQWKDWKLPSAVTMVKHILEGYRVPGVVIKRGVEEGEEPSYSVVNLWDSVEASQDMKGVPLKGDVHNPTETSDNMHEVRNVTSEEAKQEARKSGMSLSKQQLHAPLARHTQSTRSKTAVSKQPEGDDTDGATAAGAWHGSDSGSESEDDVDSIVDHNVYDIDQDLWEYKVRWSGYTPEHDSWHTEADLPTLNAMI